MFEAGLISASPAGFSTAKTLLASMGNLPQKRQPCGRVVQSALLMSACCQHIGPMNPVVLKTPAPSAVA